MGPKGVPIGGFLSAQLAELWALWREYVNLSGDSCDLTATLVKNQVRCNPCDEETKELLPPLPFWLSLSLTGDSDFTLGSSESQNMNYMVGMVRSPNIALVTPDVLNNEGFEGWWLPVEKMLGQIDRVMVDTYSLLIHYLGTAPRGVGPTPCFATRIGKIRNLFVISSKM